jgi:hypothetical protein
MDTKDEQLKGITAMVKQTEKLREELNYKLLEARRDIETTRHDFEATWREFESQLTAVETRTT